MNIHLEGGEKDMNFIAEEKSADKRLLVYI
jgi:hypothetical protein